MLTRSRIKRSHRLSTKWFVQANSYKCVIFVMPACLNNQSSQACLLSALKSQQRMLSQCARLQMKFGMKPRTRSLSRLTSSRLLKSRKMDNHWLNVHKLSGHSGRSGLSVHKSHNGRSVRCLLKIRLMIESMRCPIGMN